MPRKLADRHIEIGRYKPAGFSIGFGEYEFWRSGVDTIDRADSIKFLDKRHKRTRYLKIAVNNAIVHSKETVRA